MSDFTNELGVVDPIRPPADAVRFAGRLRALPLYAQGFLLLAVTRAVVDVATAVSQVSPGIGVSPILGLVLGALPDWVTLLIPVAVAWATQTTGAASRGVVRGSIAIGLSEVLRIAATFVQTADPSALAFLPQMFVVTIATLLLAVGLVWLANGLEVLRRHEPTQTIQRAAVAVVVIGVLTAVVDLGTRLIQATQLDTDGEPAILVANLLGSTYVAVVLGWTFLARALLRSGGDAGRPRSATRAGVIAGGLAGLWLLAWLLSFAVIVPFAADLESWSTSSWRQIYSLVSVIATACSVGAIVYLALGLGTGLGSEVADVPVEEPANSAPLTAR